MVGLFKEIGTDLSESNITEEFKINTKTCPCNTQYFFCCKTIYFVEKLWVLSYYDLDLLCTFDAVCLAILLYSLRETYSNLEMLEKL